MEPEPIGVIAWAEVKRHSRILYIRLEDLNVRLYDIRPGDKLKVELHSISKGVRE
jgi:hypothetical protein